MPIFHGERLIGFSQVFGHHDDVGGSVPGSLPVHATDSWMEGVLVPPIKLYDTGKLNKAAFRIITRNSRLSEHLAGDMDAEIGAARLGSRRIVALADRYGVDTLEAAFDQILKNTAEIFRREILPKIKDGVYHYEDYIEADGVDAPRLHALRLTMTKTPEKIVLDFNGTDPEAKGPINWALDEAEGRYFRKWLAPTLRSLAATPERAAEIDSNEGVLDVVEVVFPPKGTLITPNFSKPTGMRFFLMLRSLGVFAACLSKATGGRMPGDHETIRIWGLTGGRTQPRLLPLPRGARRRQSRPAVGGRLRRRPRRAQLEEPAGRVLRDALPDPDRAARPQAGFRRRRLPARRPRLRQAHPRARRLPADLQCRPLAPRLLRRQRRQGRPAATASR